MYVEPAAGRKPESLGWYGLEIEASLVVSKDAFRGLTGGSMVFHPK